MSSESEGELCGASLTAGHAKQLDDHKGTPADPMTKAVLQLTQIVGKLSKRKEDTLEDTLDAMGGTSGSGSADVSASLGRKHAAARQALIKTFKDNPAQIWKSIENNMSQDFHLCSALPNSSAATFTARGWAEHRSKIQGYVRTVRWVWGIAGVLDSLRDGQTDAARARCCLLLAMAEQESLDHGSFLLAQEFSMEPAAPVSSFQQHVLPEPTEMATTKLLDPRWIEAFADRLKQVDSYMEMRKKLNLRSKPAPVQTPLKEKGKGGGGGGKGKGKKSEKPEGEAD